jgi:acyl carrier protein
MFTTIQSLIEQETKLLFPAALLTPLANLYELGLTSFDAVRLLVAVERAFKVELPRETLTRETMTSIASIAKAVQAAQTMRNAGEPDRKAA